MSPSGFNQREEDVCSSFASAVDGIIRLKPDFVLHTGDLFHTVRPTNRIINFAVRQILRITDSQIPVVIISGNHDTPKQRAVGSVFSFFEVLSPHLHLVYKNQYELIRLTKTAIHAIPHCLDQEDLHRQLAKVQLIGRPKAAHNILMLHGVVAGIPEFSMGELAEQEIPSSYLRMPFDYVAMGHYHRYCEVEPSVYYAGSTERLSMAELDQEKGFVEVDLEGKEVKFNSVPTRDMIELSSVDAAELSQEQVLLEIEKKIGMQETAEKIVRLKVENIPEHIYNSLDFRRIGELKSKAFHFDLRFNRKEEAVKDQSDRSSIGRLTQEFAQFLKQAAVEDLKKERLLQLGLGYLSTEPEGEREPDEIQR